MTSRSGPRFTARRFARTGSIGRCGAAHQEMDPMETQYSAESVYRDHVETRRTLTQPLRFLILGRLVEPLRRLEIWELEEHEALGLPIALQHRELTAARDEAA